MEKKNIKRNLLLSLCVLGGLVTVTLVPQVNAQEIVSTISAVEQKSIYSQAIKAKNYGKIPKELRGAITPDTVLGPKSIKNQLAANVVYYDKETGLILDLFQNKILARRIAATEADIFQPLPAFSSVNAKNQPWFEIPTPLKKELAKNSEKLAYYETMAKILNETWGKITQVPLVKPVRDSSDMGKVLDLLVYTKKQLPGITENMSEDEIEIRDKVGYTLDGTAKIPNLVLTASGSYCFGWFHQNRYSGNPMDGGISLDNIMVCTGDSNPEGKVTHYKAASVHSHYQYVTAFYEGLKELLIEKGGKPGIDLRKEKELSAEEKLLSAWLNVAEDAVSKVQESMTKDQNKPSKGEFIRYAEKLSPNYGPSKVVSKGKKMLEAPQNGR